MGGGKHTVDLVYLLIGLLLVNSVILLSVEGQEEPITIHVTDPLGKPLNNVEVVLSRLGETYRFITNSTGHAIFKDLPEGVYDVKVRLDQVTIAESQIEYPKQKYLEVAGNISEIEFRLFDLDGKGVEGLEIVLEAFSKFKSYKDFTDENGVVKFSRIPYSTLKDISGYNLKINFNNYPLETVKDLEISSPKLKFNFTVQLLNLNITTVNLEGESVAKTVVKFQARNYTRSMKLDKGAGTVNLLPSSNLDWVGEYKINVTYTIAGVEYLVHSSRRILSSSQKLDLVLDLGKLEVRVLDEDGEPLSNLTVTISNMFSRNFMSSVSDEDGIASFINLPLSEGVSKVGEYTVEVMKKDKKLGEGKVSLNSAKTSITITLKKMTVDLYFTDYNNDPLKGYNVKLVDESTGESYTGVIDNEGKLSLKMFPGDYILYLMKEEETVYRGRIVIEQDKQYVKIESINFPFKLKVIDVFGRSLEKLGIVVKYDGKEIYSGSIADMPALILPYPTTIIVDIKDNDKLIGREIMIIDKPGEYKIEIQNYIQFLGVIMSMESLATVIIALISILLMVCGCLLIYLSFSKKRKLITS
ncbi:MAG: carboxypeptidase-like regulatory domain-containing protein [Nitrososphaerota archaeon]